MPTVAEIEDYIYFLPQSEAFLDLDDADRERYIFDAKEMLMFYAGSDASLNERIVALQVLHTFSGESDEWNKFNTHGVSSYSVKDVSISFKGDDTKISLFHPEVAQFLFGSLNRGGRVGRLI